MNLRGRAGFALAVVGDLAGAGAVLLLAGRPWQTIHVQRPRPLADEIVQVSARTLQPALAALAVVALAGAVAVLATTGVARRMVGVVITLTGAAMLVVAAAGFRAVSAQRARELVSSARSGVGLATGQSPAVTVHRLWPLITIGSAAVVVGAGVLVALIGHTWSGLSNRYEAPTAAARAGRPRTDAALWNSLDRGEDPTVHTES